MTSTPRYNTEAEIDEVILRLDLTLVKPDDDISRQHQINAEPTSPGHRARAAPDNNGLATCDAKNDKTDAAAKMNRSQVTSTSSSSQADDDKKKSKPLDFIRKLRQTDSHLRGNAAASDAGSKRKSPEPLKVDSLPQKFIAKYIGCKSCRGLWGIQHTREPVDALVDDLRRLERGEDLPLVCLDVSISGISVAVHPRSRSRRSVHGLLPLEFISYAVQDTRYSRIFAFILVHELSSRARATECHAYLCDSPVSARKLALSVALAFRLYERSLAGKTFRFTVDLRSAEEMARDKSSSSESPTCASEFDA